MSLVDEYRENYTVHDLKCWPDPFQAVWDGRKRAELRKNDRSFRVGDLLVLREWDPVTREYSGRECVVPILHITLGARFGLEPGYVMLSIDDSIDAVTGKRRDETR